MSRHPGAENSRSSDVPRTDTLDAARRKRGSHLQRRHDSRAALLRSALTLVADGASFEGLSLRRVATHADLAPSAFYRYFDSLEELEVALVENCFQQLRGVLRATNLESGLVGPDGIGAALGQFVGFVRDEHAPLSFVARQRVAGSQQARRLIRVEIRVITGQLGLVLARYEPMQTWPVRANEMLAGLIINALMRAIDRLLAAHSQTTDDPIEDITDELRTQLEYLLIATRHWHPDRASSR